MHLGHPYQLNAGNRCADRPFPRSRSTVRAKGMRSLGPLVCVLTWTSARTRCRGGSKLCEPLATGKAMGLLGGCGSPVGREDPGLGQLE